MLIKRYSWRSEESMLHTSRRVKAYFNLSRKINDNGNDSRNLCGPVDGRGAYSMIIAQESHSKACEPLAVCYQRTQKGLFSFVVDCSRYCRRRVDMAMLLIDSHVVV
jgi:hypothetical protein